MYCKKRKQVSSTKWVPKKQVETNLHNWQLASIHEDNSHLQQNSEGVPSVVGIELLEALSTIPTLQRKGSLNSSASRPRFQTPGFSSTHNGGKLSSVFRTPSNACGSGYVGCCRAVLDFQLSRDQQHLAATPPFSPVAVAVVLFFYTGSATCTTFTSLLHAEELPGEHLCDWNTCGK
jgi:hypothetical protein